MARLPSDIPGLFRWWRSDDATAGKAELDPIPTWVDRIVGQSLAPLTPASSAPHRSTPATGMNGIPAVTSAGTTGVSLAGTLDLPDDYTLGVVWHRTTATTPRGIASIYGATVENRRFVLNMSAVDTVSLGNYRDLGGYVGSDSIDPAMTSTPNVLTGTAQRAGVELFQNGVSNGLTPATADLPPNTGAAGTFRLFIANSGSSNSLAGRIWEFCIWDHALNDWERARWHSYVQDRYGIAVADYQPGPPADSPWRQWDGTTEVPLILEGYRDTVAPPETVPLPAALADVAGTPVLDTTTTGAALPVMPAFAGRSMYTVYDVADLTPNFPLVARAWQDNVDPNTRGRTGIALGATGGDITRLGVDFDGSAGGLEMRGARTVGRHIGAAIYSDGLTEGLLDVDGKVGRWTGINPVNGFTATVPRANLYVGALRLVCYEVAHTPEQRRAVMRWLANAHGVTLPASYTPTTTPEMIVRPLTPAVVSGFGNNFGNDFGGPA